MKTWHKDNYWVSKMPFKVPTTRDLILVDIKAPVLFRVLVPVRVLVNLCLQIKDGLIE